LQLDGTMMVQMSSRVRSALISISEIRGRPSRVHA
jgi:hypothetical protein